METTNKILDELNNTRRGSLKINRIGILVRDDGSRVLLPPDVLAKSAAFFSDRPIKLDHDGENIGVIKQAMFDGSFTRAEYVLFNGYEGENREVSAGYRALYSETPGVWIDHNGVMGEVGKEYNYDKIATSILPDHAAIVEKGRAGELVTIELDTAELILKEEKPIKNTKIMANTKKVKNEIKEESPAIVEAVEDAKVDVVESADIVAEASIEDVKVVEEVKSEEPKAEEPKVDEPKVLSTEEREELTAADLLEYIKKVELKLDSLLVKETVEEDAKKLTDEMWSKDAVKARIKKVMGAARLGISLDSDMLVADCGTLDKYILDSLGFESDSVIDVDTVLLLKASEKEEDAKLKVFRSETEKKVSNPKIKVIDEDRLTMII